jgi:parallel beta-helix repeat protein
MGTTPERLPVFAKGGVSKFIELEDVPKSYAGQAGKVVQVKSTEDGLEFQTIVSGKRTATFIVAANNSLDKSMADFVCDGVNDQIEINQAINSLPTGGGRVVLLEGTYYISGSISISKSNVILEGQGDSTVIYLVDGANAHCIVSSGVSNIKISNLKIDGNKGNQTVNVNGIYLNNGSNITIEKCTITNAKFMNIYLDSLSNNVIKNCLISGSGAIGLFVYNSQNAIITGNIVNNSGTVGIYVDFTNYGIVSCNISYSNLNNGILVEDCNYIEVSNNISRNNTNYGIIVNNSSNSIITNNHCLNNTYDGIRLMGTSSYCIVANNRCLGNGQYGIRIFSSTCSNNYVVKNYLTGNTAGSLSDSGTGTILGASTTNDNVV